MKGSLYVAACLAAVSWLCPASDAAEPRPVAIVGSGALGEADRRFFEYYVTAELGVVSEDRGDFLDPAEFGRYSMVAWLRDNSW